MKSIASAETLEEYLQGLNEVGLDPTVPILGSNGQVYLTYGEERSGGGEWMTCWLVNGDPYSSDIAWTSYCDDCGQPHYVGMRLDDPLVKYPVTVLHDPKQVS